MSKFTSCICPEEEWDGVEEALFFAQREMENFPPEAQWFLNRLGQRVMERAKRRSEGEDGDE